MIHRHTGIVDHLVHHSIKRIYSRASIFMALAMADIVIVSTLIVHMVGDDYRAHTAQLHGYAVRWNILNLFRMGLVATTVAYLFQAFRVLDRTRL